MIHDLTATEWLHLRMWLHRSVLVTSPNEKDTSFCIPRAVVTKNTNESKSRLFTPPLCWGITVAEDLEIPQLLPPLTSENQWDGWWNTTNYNLTLLKATFHQLTPGAGWKLLLVFDKSLVTLCFSLKLIVNRIPKLACLFISCSPGEEIFARRASSLAHESRTLLKHFLVPL